MEDDAAAVICIINRTVIILSVCVEFMNNIINLNVVSLTLRHCLDDKMSKITDMFIIKVQQSNAAAPRVLFHPETEEMFTMCLSRESNTGHTAMTSL